MHDLIQPVLEMARRLPCEELPELMGDLERVRCVALARLTTQTVAVDSDELLDVGTAARKLGISKDYLYRHSDEFPFARRVGRQLRFSSLGIDACIREGGLTARRRGITLAPSPIRGKRRNG